MKNAAKIQLFLAIAQKLNLELGSTPVLYGSLGLSQSIEVEIKTDDIDILVEEQVFRARLDELRGLMASFGFELVDPEENKFKQGLVEVGIASDGDLLSFSGTDPLKLKIVNTSSASYRVLNAQQYLATYEASSKDGYRKHKHLKDDRSKIRLIKEAIFA